MQLTRYEANGAIKVGTPIYYYFEHKVYKVVLTSINENIPYINIVCLSKEDQPITYSGKHSNNTLPTDTMYFSSLEDLYKSSIGLYMKETYDKAMDIIEHYNIIKNKYPELLV